MDRRSLARALVLLAGLWEGGAAAYTSQPEIVVTRTFSDHQVAPGQVVTVSLTAEVGALGADPIRGLYFVDNVPIGLAPSQGDVYLGGVNVAALREVAPAGTVFTGCTSERWVLETPPLFGEDTPVAASSTLVVTYTVTVPAGAAPGPITFPGFAWVGMIVAAGDAGDHFGYEDIAATITVESPDAGGVQDGASGVDAARADVARADGAGDDAARADAARAEAGPSDASRPDAPGADVRGTDAAGPEAGSGDTSVADVSIQDDLADPAANDGAGVGAGCACRASRRSRAWMPLAPLLLLVLRRARR